MSPIRNIYGNAAHFDVHTLSIRLIEVPQAMEGSAETVFKSIE